MEDYIDEMLAKMKNLRADEFENFCIEAKKHGIIIAKDDPLPPDPTHPHPGQQ